MVYYVDGHFVDSGAASIPVTDLALLRGYGVFDYLRTYRGRPFHLQEHLERLQRSAALIGLELPRTLDEITAIIHETMERSAYPESSIRIVVTGGDSPDNLVPVSGRSRLLVLVTPPPTVPDHWFTDGIKVITHLTERFMPEAKTLNYIPGIIALQKAQQQQASEALYINQRNEVLEGTTTNLFAFYGDTLITPGDDILRGITRQAVLHAASGTFESSIHPLPLDELLQADEVFITSSNREICPVTMIDGQPVGSGRSGTNTLRLHRLFREFTAEYA